MTRHFQILTFICLLNFGGAFSQTKDTISCQNYINEFINYAKDKDYEKAYKPWLWSFQHCPEASFYIYYYGLKIVEDRYEKENEDRKIIVSNLIDNVFLQRIKFFPKNLGRVYSDWASSLENRGSPLDAIFEKYQMAFDIDPSQ